MNCPNCHTKLETMVRVLYPMEQRDEVRVLGGDAEEGILRVEFTGETELVEAADTQQGLECPHCQHEVEGLTADALEFVDAPPPIHEAIGLDGEAQARGRNGWFSPSELVVQRSEAEGTIGLSVRSRRAYSDIPPIYMSLCLADAESLHRALGRQIAALDAVRTASECNGGEPS